MGNAAESFAPVVIVGGGPVGVGLAIDLGLRGIHSIVVERYTDPQPIPKGQNLTQRTMEHFYFWGVEDELRAARTIPRGYGIVGVTAYGNLLSAYSYDWLRRELVRPFYFTSNERLPQYATEAVMRRRAAEIPAIRTMYGWTCETVRQDGDSVCIDILNRDRTKLRGRFEISCQAWSSSSKAFASFRSSVSKPSVNQP